MNTLLTKSKSFALRFARDKAANTAMIFAIALIPLSLAAGFAIDLRRAESARSFSQDAIDAAALAAASSRERNDAALVRSTEQLVRANLATRNIDVGALRVRVVDGRQVVVNLRGRSPGYFTGLWGRSHLDFAVTSTAVRGITDTLEVALVLDNTYSMLQVDGSGMSRINALKAAATDLVRTVSEEAEDNARFTLVPYADYVNVGVGNRTAPWLSVPADYVTLGPLPPPRTCRMETRTTRPGPCTTNPPRTCTRTRDGVLETYQCGGGRTCPNVPSPPYQVEVCSGGGTQSRTNHRWLGCVYSRPAGFLRHNDTRPEVPYVGIMETSGSSQKCLNPVIPLTTNAGSITGGINSMNVNPSGWVPETYMPGGLVWGVNMLSPTAPFTDAAAYGPDNRRPRKIMVLMTDGQNTLGFRPSNGAHEGGYAAIANADTVAVCRYAHSRGIEVYSVAMAIDSAAGRATMRACASDADHFYEASDGAELRRAFAEIAASINSVRLAH